MIKMSEEIEFLDVVDNDDKVIGKEPVNIIYERLLPHRIVHVLIFDHNGNMALQLRGDKCRFCPKHWSTAVGGHVQSGETYEEGALREYEEELGARSNLEFFSKDIYQAEGKPVKFLVTFKTIYEGQFRLEEGKVDKVEFFNIEQIRLMINKGEKFHPELLFLLKKHFL